MMWFRKVELHFTSEGCEVFGWFKRNIDRHPNRHLTVYLHFPCFDGIASAALMAEALRNEGGTSLGRIVPVTYDLRDQWLKTKLDPNSAVVDFLFHPDAQYWVDHHATTFVNESCEREYSTLARKRRFHYQPDAESCAKVVWTSFGASIVNKDRFRELVSWANKIDSAAYASVREALLDDDPALRINRSLTVSPDPIYCEFLVRSIMASGLTITARSPEVVKRSENAKKRLMRGLRIAEKSIRLVDGVAVMELSIQPRVLVSRYAPYYFYPDARYSITYTHHTDGTKITAMRNPWLEFESVALGKVMSRYGGGGHSRVGSVFIPNSDREEVSSVINDLLSHIHDSYSAISHVDREGIHA